MTTRIVGDLMSTEVECLGRNDKLSVADDVMRLRRIRHLPVLDEDGDVAGVVSQRDLFRGALVKALGYGDVAQNKVMNTILIKEVMSTPVLTTTPSTPITEAAQRMLEHRVGCLPVIDDGRLVGILTEGDFVAELAGRA